MIKVEKIWLSTEAVDMRAGPDTLLAKVVKAFGEAQAHHAYLFTNKRCNRMKILVSDSFGLWMLARRLHEGKFHWIKSDALCTRVLLSDEQWRALIVGLPWQQVHTHKKISVL